MNQKKSTKRTLITSALSLVLCMAMLIGATFAWFTDSVTSTNNIIKSGTLDVALEYKEMNEDAYKDASQGAIFNYDKWEPGYVDVKHVKVSNKGTLALKYQLNIIANTEVAAGEANLADVIDVYMVEGAQQITRETLANAASVGTLSSLMADADGAAYGFLSAGTSKEVTIALKMQESAGNEYQNLSVGDGFAVQLLATQYTEETDSFDHQYDKDAAYPNVVFDAKGLKEALAAGKDVVLSENIKTEATDKAPYGNLVGFVHDGTVFDGNGKTISVTNGGEEYAVMTSGGTIKNLKVDDGFRGIMIMNPKQTILLDNVTVSGDVCYALNTAEGNGTQDLIVTNSTLNGWTSIGTAVQSANFTNCTFGQGSYYTDVYGRLVKPYINTTFKNCEFNSKFYIDLSQLGKDGKNVLNDDAYIVLENCTVNGVKLTAENWTSLIVSEDDCGDGQISVEAKDGTYMSASNVLDYVIIK